MTVLRLSEHHQSETWLTQFRTPRDRALAAQMLNSLKLVSIREFERGLEQALSTLQHRLRATIAVYPIAPSQPPGVIGYRPFIGAISTDPLFSAAKRHQGRRRHYGSEDRVGHILAKLQKQIMHSNKTSRIEREPTHKQLDSQGIRHIVLVDDICGSGTRITDYWRNVVSKRIKSLLSLDKCELWVLTYAITPSGREAIAKAMPHFPSDHLISLLSPVSIGELLNPDILSLCTRYAVLAGRADSALGYKNSASLVIFEHGCPNNAPAILWAQSSAWRPLFPNGSIPEGMRSCFDEHGLERAIEHLWSVNQRTLAVQLLSALGHDRPLSPADGLLLTVIGLRLRKLPEHKISALLHLTQSEVSQILRRARGLGLYAPDGVGVTQLGREFIARFRARSDGGSRSKRVGKDLASYYPRQCGGEIFEPGKTVWVKSGST